jgi:hypothetical protein
MTGIHSGNWHVTYGCAGDDSAVMTLSEDKKLADVNVGSLDFEELCDRAAHLPVNPSRGLALAFRDCGSLLFAAPFGLPAGG